MEPLSLRDFLADSCAECPVLGLMATFHVQVGRWGRGMVTQPSSRGLSYPPCSFRRGVASWNISKSSDGSQTCSWEGHVSCLLPGFWNSSQLLETDPSPRSQDGPLHPSIHHTGPESCPSTGLPASCASASVGSSESHISKRCLCSVNAHIVRPLPGSFGRDTCLP